MTLNHRYVYLVVSLISMGFIAALWMSNDEQARRLSTEDGLIESLSAAFWVAGMGCCLVAIKRRRFVRFAYLWLALCFVFLGEETSWFQRYLGYSVPIVQRASTQSEFNIHNLGLWRDIIDPQFLFTLGMLVYFLLLPIAMLRGSARSLAAKIRFPDPTIVLGLSLWIPVAVSLVVASDPEVHHAVAETREMLYAFCALLYTFSLAVRHDGLFKAWPPFMPSGSVLNRLQE